MKQIVQVNHKYDSKIQTLDNVNFRINSFLKTVTDSEIQNDLLLESGIISKKQFDKQSNCISRYNIRKTTYHFQTKDWKLNKGIEDKDEFKEFINLQGVNSCNSSKCKKCMKRVMTQRSKTLSYLMKSYSNEYKYHFVTLTVPNVSYETLQTGYDNLKKLWNKFNKVMKWKDYVKKFETTFNNEKKTWHIHFHVLLASKKQENVDYKTIQETWTQYSKYWFKTESAYFNTDIKLVGNQFNTLELTKYVNKEIFQFDYKMSYDQNIEAKQVSHLFWTQLANKKFLTRKGIFNLGFWRKGDDVKKLSFLQNDNILELFLKHSKTSKLMRINDEIVVSSVDEETGELEKPMVQNIDFNKVLGIILHFLETLRVSTEKLQNDPYFVSKSVEDTFTKTGRRTIDNRLLNFVQRDTNTISTNLISLGKKIVKYKGKVYHWNSSTNRFSQ